MTFIQQRSFFCLYNLDKILKNLKSHIDLQRDERESSNLQECAGYLSCVLVPVHCIQRHWQLAKFNQLRGWFGNGDSSLNLRWSRRLVHVSAHGDNSTIRTEMDTSLFCVGLSGVHSMQLLSIVLYAHSICHSTRFLCRTIMEQ